ncbi:hypothetical protein SOCE26_008780 [Sorangium cellulosum]|uniref:Uncharacterized protein n=1 Tax=Sorangium cellulosum TaxID=56 RepID=A0A2L0EJL6_SORCE|nr:hypothetical protein [Sorangium cellulosum]AUX39486.1 hypothetical protein SOCE26_008780 [Sorangium cellulosum]
MSAAVPEGARTPPTLLRRRTSLLVLLPALLAGLGACRGDAGGEGAGAPSSDGGAALAAEGTPAPRRPTRYYHLRRTDEGCETFWIDGDLVSASQTVLCPPDLLVGERLRLTGKTCIRESAQTPARAVPVICPLPLTNMEKADRTPPDAGASPDGGARDAGK